MKLLRLKIRDEEGFRSLNKDFEIFFLRDFDYKYAKVFNPYILAGSNGSGKSNVLEALAEIFFHLDCIYLRNKPDYFDKSDDNPSGFDPTKSRINSYELEYFNLLDKNRFPGVKESKPVHIRIEKEINERPIIKWLNEEDFRIPEKLTQLEVKSLLPEYVVGFASGKNETLSLPFFKSRFLQYDEYLRSLQSEEFVDPKPEASLVYLDEAFSQAILLTNLLMQDSIDENDDSDILRPFKEYVQLVDIDEFRLIIRTDKGIEIKDQEESGSGDDFSDKLESEASGSGSSFVGKETKLLQNIDLQTNADSKIVRSYLEKLKRCATVWFHEGGGSIQLTFEEKNDSSFGNEYLVLDFKVNIETKKAFRFHFENNPLKLFELFQLLLVLNNNEVSIKNKKRVYSSNNIYINNDISQQPLEEDRILRFKDFKIKKTGLKESIYTKALSDGEHQFLHSLGLCLLFKDTRSLFLLDEPETHFNPDWKAQFISSLRSSLNKEKEKSENTMRDMLITTHSPYLISDSRMEYVLVLKKDKKTGKVMSADRPDFQTFGTSVNKIGIRIFEMPNTIGEYAQKKLDEFDDELKQTNTQEDLENLIARIKAEMGESVERVLFVNKVIDKIESLN